jgi:multidrug efflux system membrane fusion protein
VYIEIETVSYIVTIPIEALFTEGGGDYVYVVRDERAYLTAVEIGRLTDVRAEIRSGVGEGDAVVVSSVSGLDDGIRVRIR